MKINILEEEVGRIRRRDDVETDVIKRLEKIENSFNELQMAILGKIGNYSQDLQNLSQELNATQDSFSKVLNPIIDAQREQPKSKERPREKPKKGASDFEKFLR